MRDLSTLSNEEIFDVMIAVYEPYSGIMSDKEVKEAMKNGINEGFKVIREKHMDDAVKICAILDGQPVDGYKMGVFTFMRRFSELMSSDLGLDSVFTGQETPTENGSSGSAMENTVGVVG